MYVYYFVHLDGTPSEWSDRLDAHPDGVQALASAALADHGCGGAGITLGRSHKRSRGYLVPVHWLCPALSTELDGDLSVEPVDHDFTQITLRATYTSPPAEDPAASHRRVEAVVKRFLDSLVALADGGFDIGTFAADR